MSATRFVERVVLHHLVTELLAQPGIVLSVNDGEETTVLHSTSREDILAALRTTDQDALIVSRITTGPYIRLGSLDLVYGNDGFDVIADGHSHLWRMFPMTWAFCMADGAEWIVIGGALGYDDEHEGFDAKGKAHGRMDELHAGGEEVRLIHAPADGPLSLVAHYRAADPQPDTPSLEDNAPLEHFTERHDAPGTQIWAETQGDNRGESFD